MAGRPVKWGAVREQIGPMEGTTMKLYLAAILLTISATEVIVDSSTVCAAPPATAPANIYQLN